jgi:glycosyltransferase involved in cell wall biosynthesis
MKQPLVSVVVAAFNYGKYIAETLQSVENQTYINWECIVVDDGSTDNTREVVEAFTSRDKRFQYHYQANKGLPATRNAAIKLAKGEFFQWLDADDLLQKDKLKLKIEVFEKEPGIEMVYGGLRYFYDEKPSELIFSPHFNRPWTLTKSGNTLDILPLLVVSCIIMPSMPLLRRSVLEKAGNFDESYRYVEDWNFWLRCFVNGLNIKYLEAPETYILMRLHQSSMTKSRINMINGFLKLRNEFDTWEVSQDMKKLNLFLLKNDEIELFLTQKALGENITIQRRGLRFNFFKFISKFNPHISLKLLNLFKSVLKKYYHLKYK